MTIGEIIREYRTINNLSMEEFALKCGLSKGYISMLENNKNPRSGKPIIPSIETIRQVANGMATDIDALIAKLDDGQPISMGKFKNSTAIDAISYAPATRIPILGRIAAGYPLYAEEHIEGYTYIDTPEDGEYFGLVVSGDSMDAARIQDGDLLIVRRQSCVDNGDIAVVLVNGCDATVKRFYKHDNMVTLVPQSSNPRHVPQMYDLDKTELQIQGKVVEVKIRV